ncbi:hypothetical protein Tco_1261937 [Tanacetum coccineum]
MSQSSKQLLTANQLVPVNHQYDVAKANKKVDLINIPCLAASKIIREILQRHLLCYALTASASVPLIYMQCSSYPCFTKLIINHILTAHPDIPKRLSEPHHLVEHDHVLLSIFASGNSKGRGMGIPDYLLTAEIMQTNAYKVYVADSKLVALMTQSQPIESSPGTHKTPSAPSAQEAEAQANVHLVEQHLMDEDINQIVEGDESDADKFADDMIMSQDVTYTRIDPGSQKECLEALKVVYYVAVNEEEEEETAKAS